MNYIIQISDIHLLNNSELSLADRSPAEQLKLAINDIVKKFDNKSAFLILTGDLVSHPTPECYQKLADYFNKLTFPVYVLAGNHDAPAFIETHFRGNNIHHAKSINADSWLIVLLDSSTPGKNLGSGKLSNKELIRLTNLLDKNQDKNIMLFLHHPPVKFGAHWFQDICLENGDALCHLIRANKNIKCVSFGHAHTEQNFLIENVLYCCSPSTWLQVDHTIDTALAYTSLPGGYRWFNLQNDGTLYFGTNYF